MKKLIFTAVFATLVSVAAFADGGKKASTTTGEENVSYAVLTQFQNDFADASNIAWTVAPNSQKVSFTKDNVNYTAYYDSIDQFYGVAQEVDFASVTKEVKKTIAKNYADYTIESVTKFEAANDGEEPAVYFISLKNAKENVILTISPIDGQIKNIDK